jgi:hypothetical protein
VAVLVAVAATAIGVLAGLASGSSPATAPRTTDPAALGRHATWTTVFTATGGIRA